MLGGWPGIDDSEREAIFFIADISGHTTFIFANEKEVSHSLMVIREIITSLMNRVVTPLQLVRIEGDAIFLYVLKDAPEHPCGKVSKTLASDMAAFFQVFSHELSELMIHKVCNCNACVHIEQLKLKVVARGGTAAFYQLGDHQELTGTSPIVIHRLMKNSVQATEYMLFTVSAYRDIAPTDWEVEAGEEDHDDIGNIKTFLHYPLEPETFVLSSDSKPPAVLIDTLRSEVSREYYKWRRTRNWASISTPAGVSRHCWSTGTIGLMVCLKRPQSPLPGLEIPSYWAISVRTKKWSTPEARPSASL